MKKLESVDFINIISCLRFSIENCDDEFLIKLLKITLLKVQEIYEERGI